jgi:SAM-dependent methyltransferase
MPQPGSDDIDRPHSDRPRGGRADGEADAGEHDGFGSDTYGRSFADVYDEWYPADSATQCAVDRIAELAGPGGSVLELGVGTGRLAIPLARRGHPVTGVDSSTDMLDRLAANAASLAPESLTACRGDVADPDGWPVGPFQVVVAAFNLVCNLVEPSQQARMFDGAADALAPGGHLVVETFLPAPVHDRERHLEVREVRADRVVLIASDTDPSEGIVTGQHIELRDGEPVRLRPWRLRLTSPTELDRWAEAAGLERVHVWQGWSTATDRTGDDTDVHNTGDDHAARVAVYRRAPDST